MWTKAGNVCFAIAVLLLAYLGYEQLRAMYIKKQVMSSMAALEVPVEEGPSVTPVNNEKKEAGVELNIPKIQLNVPVLEGTTVDILRVAIGHLQESGRLGASGENFVLLGHRSHVTGRFFNRLDEMKVKDTIFVTANGKIYTYEVIEKKIIDPHELEVIQPRDGLALLTLITCHPEYSSKQRLVVISKRIEI